MIIRYTSTLGHNAQAFANIVTLYGVPNGRVVDLTYGMGGFWHKVDVWPNGKFWIRPTFCDLQQRPGVHVVCDARQTPFRDGEFDMAVLDPPYRRNRVNSSDLLGRDFGPRYGLDVVESKEWNGMMGFYASLIQEAKRITRPGGVVVVKGMDDKRHWFIRDLPLCGMRIEDVHVVTTQSKPMQRHNYQLHARKNHSYFVILRRSKRTEIE